MSEYLLLQPSPGCQRYKVPSTLFKFLGKINNFSLREFTLEQNQHEQQINKYFKWNVQNKVKSPNWHQANQVAF